MKSPDLFDLSGRNILLTGAAGYLGSVLAMQLCRAGAHVLLNGRTPASLARLAAQIGKARGKASILDFDICSEASAVIALRKIKARFRSLEGIVHNAYGSPPPEAGQTEAYLHSYQVAVAAPFAFTEMALPLLKQGARRSKGGASVVHISSMYGRVSPNPGVYRKDQKGNPAHYGAAKAAVHQLTRYWSCHLAPHNIRVNSLSPGPFPDPAALQPDPDFSARLAEKVPLKRIGVPVELAGPLIFLLSPASSYVTGCNLPVDGGWTAW